MAETIYDALLDYVDGISGYEGTLTDPQWDRTTKVHDWRNHVPNAIRDVWDRLPTEARVVAYVFAREAANAEEWE